MSLSLATLFIVAAIPAAGFLYQVLGSRRDRRRYTSRGRLVEIGVGQKLYVVEKGSGCPPCSSKQELLPLT